MDGFNCIFDDATREYKANESQLECFRFARNIYGFCINEGGIDNQALNYALEINKELYNKYINVPKGVIGYKGHEDKYLAIDDIDSKHILQLTFLSNKLNAFNRIVEIGGGFGNMIRLSKDIIAYDSWNIIDIPHMLKLQQYYLEKEILDISKIHFVSGNSNIDYSNTPIDLVIATHSISELSWDIFIKYFDKVIKYSKYLYIGFNKNAPSTELINMKINHINRIFKLEDNFDYTEVPYGAHVSYSLYKHIAY